MKRNIFIFLLLKKVRSKREGVVGDTNGGSSPLLELEPSVSLLYRFLTFSNTPNLFAVAKGTPTSGANIEMPV